MGDGPDVYSSNCMIDLYCENSMVQEAESVFKNLKRRGEANEFSHAMMLCLYKKTGRFAEAYEIAQEMKALGLLTETLSYNNVISLYASDGRMKEAVENFQQMLASGVRPNDATFGLLGVVLLRRGASKEAIKHLETVRTRDAQSGVREWVKALCSMQGDLCTEHAWFSSKRVQIRLGKSVGVTPQGEEVGLPHSLRRMGQCTFTQVVNMGTLLLHALSSGSLVKYN
ncbi:pentatricopeptide repeat-containing protein [Iris pallida]|uniref:Pentatricopeptide repeat-containing protein n=1 Tax=Iris pallida TaxID=29817 RepID=A0AAX6FBI3_IRIPA|nr:pentatricopeptide repeat-containing protein [Iris pallida]